MKVSLEWTGCPFAGVSLVPILVGVSHAYLESARNFIINGFKLLFIRLDFLICEVFYLSTLAEPPPFTFNTSASVAMVVSPGVVMARAPCAAPNSTASFASFDVRNP